MNERPLNKALEAFTDADFREFIEVTEAGQPADFSTWTGLELVLVASSSAVEPAFVGTVTPEAGKLNLVIDEATLKAQVPQNAAAAYKSFQYVLRGKPHGTYRVRLAYGSFKIYKGLPEVPA